ncbi:SDR family oxidoreductase [Roseibium sp. HPY-6]|uniref:SDR family NAD(P)-dependent oxidoreductase n=1 Tax=Roseibium sp. HPY-6 TaxID=3229852 RepID=UPI00338E1C7C
MTRTNNWQDKVAIITGGSSGIGRALALALASNGAKVLVTGRNEARLADMSDSHGSIETLKADSCEPASAKRIIESATDRWGRLDLIVNNAGAGQPLQIADYDAGLIAKMAAVNIIGPSLLLKEGHAALRASQGAIVNVGSAVSRNAVPMVAHYAATKAALEHLTRSWAVALASDGIRVNAIAPGPVKSGALTGMMGLPDEVAQQIEAQETRQIPLGRRGIPADIVAWVLRLGSPENEWLTGQVLTVDGGWTLRT